MKNIIKKADTVGFFVVAFFFLQGLVTGTWSTIVEVFNAARNDE